MKSASKLKQKEGHEKVAVFLKLLLAVEKNVASTNYQRWNNSILPLGSTVTYFKPIFFTLYKLFSDWSKIFTNSSKSTKKKANILFH